MTESCDLASILIFVATKFNELGRIATDDGGFFNVPKYGAPCSHDGISMHGYMRANKCVGTHPYIFFDHDRCPDQFKGGRLMIVGSCTQVCVLRDH
jgi:hypothetical protein